MNKNEMDFVKSALVELSNRQPKVLGLVDSAWLKIKTSDALAEMGKKVLALAVQGKCMHDGSSVFAIALAVCRHLDLNKLLGEYSKSWIEYAEKAKQ